MSFAVVVCKMQKPDCASLRNHAPDTHARYFLTCACMLPVDAFTLMRTCLQSTRWPAACSATRRIRSWLSVADTSLIVPRKRRRARQLYVSTPSLPLLLASASTGGGSQGIAPPVPRVSKGLPSHCHRGAKPTAQAAGRNLPTASCAMRWCTSLKKLASSMRSRNCFLGPANNDGRGG